MPDGDFPDPKAHAFDPGPLGLNKKYTRRREYQAKLHDGSKDGVARLLTPKFQENSSQRST